MKLITENPWTQTFSFPFLRKRLPSLSDVGKFSPLKSKLAFDVTCKVNQCGGTSKTQKNFGKQRKQDFHHTLVNGNILLTN